MWELEKTTYPIAKKNYHCEASDWVDNGCLDDISKADMATIKKAKEEGFKILLGTKYLKTTGKWDGEFSIYRCRIDLHDICIKYGIYPD